MTETKIQHWRLGKLPNAMHRLEQVTKGVVEKQTKGKWQ